METIKLRLWEMVWTEKAIKFSTTPSTKPTGDQVWLSRSLIEHITRRPAIEGSWPECEVTIPEWLAEKTGLI